jgi:hypothetical protein
LSKGQFKNRDTPIKDCKLVEFVTDFHSVNPFTSTQHPHHVAYSS